MRIISDEELAIVAGGDAAATRSGHVNSWGEPYDEPMTREVFPSDEEGGGIRD